MTCARCPSLTPITVEQAGVELCRVCAQLPAEKTTAPSEPGASTSDRPATHLRHDGRIATSLPRMAEKTTAPDCSEASDRHPPLGLVEAALRAPHGTSRSHIDHDRPTRERQAQSPARPARSKR